MPQFPYMELVMWPGILVTYWSLTVVDFGVSVTWLACLHTKYLPATPCQVFRNASYVETRQCVILNVIIVTLCHVYSLCIGDVMCGGCWCQNWYKEINKWLSSRVGVLAIDSGSKSEIDRSLGLLNVASMLHLI